MSRLWQHRYRLLATLVVFFTIAAVVYLERNVYRVEEALPLASLQKERDFSVFNLDLTRLEAALRLAIAASSTEHREQLALAIDLTSLRLEDNKTLYGRESGMPPLHEALDRELHDLEQILAQPASSPDRLRAHVEDVSRLQQAVQTANDTVFQVSISQISAQRAFLSSIRTSMFALIVLFGAGGLALVVLLLTQQRNIQTLEQREQELRSGEDVLRKSQSLLLQAQRIALIGHYLFEISGDRWTSSEMLDDIFGIDATYPRDAAHWLALVHPADRADMATYLRDQVMEERQPFDREYRIVRSRDSAVRWVHGLGQLETTADGQLTRMFGVIQDITERKQAQVCIDNERIHLRTLLATIPDLVWLKNPEGVYLTCNPEFGRFFGADEATIVGKTDYDFVDKELADFFCQKDREAIAKSRPSINEEWVTYASDGHRALLETIKTPMHDADDNLVGVLGIAHDITRRRQMEEALREEEEKLRGLYELSPLGIALTDMRSRYVEFNEAFRRICGYSAEDLKTLDYWTLTPKKYEAQEAEQLESLARSGYYGPYEKEYRRQDGSLIPLRFNGMYVTGADGQRYIWSIVEDITGQKRLEDSLRAREQEFRTLAENSPDIFTRYDRACRRTYVSPGLARLTGVPVERMLGKTPTECWPMPTGADEASAFENHLRRVLESGKLVEWEVDGRMANGDPAFFQLRGVPEFDAEGHVASVLTVARNITARKQAEGHRRLAASVFTNAHDGIIITDPDNIILDVNDAFTRITGYGREEVIGRNPRLLKSGHQDLEFYAAMWEILLGIGHWSGEVWNRRKDGEVYAELLTISAVKNERGRCSHYVGVFADITPLKEHERELERIAHFDALTGIPNRLLLVDRMSQAVAQTRRSGALMAVCYLDLDGFKPVNDTFGHEAGDRLLVEMACRLRECLRGGDTVARIGGDEFVLLLLNLERTEECEGALGRILEAVSRTMLIADQPVSVSASLGATLFPADNVDSDTLLRHADQAMYLAKQSGKNCYHLFDPEQDRLAQRRREQLSRIDDALRNEEFVLHYQPKVNLRLGTVLGAEALIRWQHPEQGLLLPAEFLPNIEDTDQIVAVGDWVMASALAQLAAWHRQGLNLTVSVNVAPRQLLCEDFVSQLKAHLASHPNAPPERLELEVLENAALKDIQHVSRVIRECRELGVTFALDDFGTGYSSLTYLKSLSAGTLKIDQSFVRDMLFDSEDMAIVEGVIGLADVFRRNIVAEGVETVDHGVLLLNLGCELAQGFGIARPMPAADLPQWVSNWRPSPKWLGAAGFRWPRDDLPLLIAESDHKRWVEAITTQVNGGSTGETPEPDPLECRFGRWCYGNGRERYGALPGFALLSSMHEEIHKLGVELLSLRQREQHQEALARLPELLAQHEHLITLLHSLVTEAMLGR